MATASSSSFASILSVILILVLGSSAVGGSLPAKVDYTYEAAYDLDGRQESLNAAFSLDTAAPSLTMNVNGETIAFGQGAPTALNGDGSYNDVQVPAEVQAIFTDVIPYMTDGGLISDLSVLIPYLGDYPDFNAFTLTQANVYGVNGQPVTRITFETSPLRLLSAAHRWAVWHANDEKLMQDVKNLKLFSLPSVKALLTASSLQPETIFSRLMSTFTEALSTTVDDAYGFNMNAPLKVTVDMNSRGVVTSAHAEILLSEGAYYPEERDERITIQADYTLNLPGSNPCLTLQIAKDDMTVCEALFQIQGSALTCSMRYAEPSGNYPRGFDFLLTADSDGLNAGLSIHDDNHNPSYTLRVKSDSISFLYLESDTNYYGAPFVRGLLTWENNEYALDVQANTFKLTGKGTVGADVKGMFNKLDLTAYTYSRSYLNEDREIEMTIRMHLDQLLRQENGVFVLTDHFEAAPEGTENNEYLTYDDTHTLSFR